MSCPYKTLVFLDLEATDLPQSRPAITEISFVACSTDHLENCCPGTEKLPRVLHKLTFCVNPQRKIAAEAVLITGLDNFLLQDESILNPQKYALLSTFLDSLQQPVCLVAHNGNCFDFPLLAKSLNNFNAMINVHCVDSLPIFRKIDEDAKKFQNLLDSELEELKQEEEESALRMLSDCDADESLVSASSLAELLETDRSPSPDLFEDIMDDSVLSQVTQEAEEKYLESSTPVAKRICMDTTPPRLPMKPPAPRIDRTRLKPRQLFKPSYKLTSIFERFFGYIPPNAHRAEEDNLILLKCAQFHAKDFLMHIPAKARELKSFVK